MWIRALPWLLYLVLAFALASLMAVPASSDSPERDIPKLPCQSVGPLSSPENEAAWSTNRGLYRNGFVRLQVCTPGSLLLVLEGTPVNGVGARVQVAWRTRVLWEGDLIGLRELDLEVPAAGWIMIAFLNDASAGEEDRNLWIHELGFVAGDSS